MPLPTYGFPRQCPQVQSIRASRERVKKRTSKSVWNSPSTLHGTFNASTQGFRMLWFQWGSDVGANGWGTFNEWVWRCLELR
jgi:hypothetical protein